MSSLPSPHLQIQYLPFLWVFNWHLGEWELLDPAAPFLSARGWQNGRFDCGGTALCLGSGSRGSWACAGSRARSCSSLTEQLLESRSLQKLVEKRPPSPVPVEPQGTPAEGSKAEPAAARVLPGRAALPRTAPGNWQAGFLQVCTRSAGFIAVMVDLPSPAWGLSCGFSFQSGLSGAGMQL